MKKSLLLLAAILTISSLRVNAQETVMDEINYNQLEKYIQMAKEYYPQRKIKEELEKQAKTEVTIQTISYLDLFNANYYYRPNEREALDVMNPYVTNGFQFGVSLNLGRYLQKPFTGKIVRSELKIAQLEKQIFDTQLEKEVKSRYYKYVLNLKELKLKTVSAQETLGNLQNITTRFEKGEIPLEEYNSARAAVLDANSTKMQTEISYLQAKDGLEEIIGSKLQESVNN